MERTEALDRGVFIGYLLAWAMQSAITLLRIPSESLASVVNGTFWVVACATTLTSLARRLPFQSVAVAGLAGVGGSALILCLQSMSDFPLGPAIYTDTLGTRVLGLFPWPLPFLWAAALLNGRGIARLILRPHRKTTYYGFWVLGLSALLCVQFNLAIEPGATLDLRWWIWDASARSPGWHGVPWSNSVGWMASSLLILAFTTPWLINKAPVKRPPDYSPLVVWFLAETLFLSRDVSSGRWDCVAATSAGLLLITWSAIRGARW